MNHRALAALVLSIVPWASACSDDSYAVVSVLTYAGTMTSVAQFRVHVGNGSSTDTLLYPQRPSENLTLDPQHPVTFSVEFDKGRGGSATFEVEPLNVNGVSMGYGKADAAIDKSKVFNVAVLVAVGAVRPRQGVDAGASADGGSGSLSCDPYNPTAACGSGETCGLICPQDSQDGAAVGMCYLAGAGAPGEACATNNDCLPGSQCFNFTAVGCAVQTCLRFCDHSDSACAEQDAYCNVPIQCGTSAPFVACSRPCDPTGAGSTGCASGLACFVFSDETTDCACPGLGALGASCTQNAGCATGATGCSGCATGYSCVVPTGADAGASTGVCRQICNLAAPSCPTGTTCHGFDGSTRKLYGFCE